MTYFPGVTSPLFSQGTLYCAYKTATETRDNTSTAADDGYLVLSNIPAGYYRLTMIIYGKYYTDAGLLLHLFGTNFAMNGGLVDHSIWDETTADPDAPTDIVTRAIYSNTDGYIGFRKIPADLVSPSHLTQFRVGLVNGDIVKFTTTGSLALRWAQDVATSGRNTEIQANSVLSLSFTHS